MLMTKAHKIITSIESSLKKYAKCDEIRKCQWIRQHIIDDASILNCTKKYVLDYGPHCNINDTTITCS